MGPFRDPCQIVYRFCCSICRKVDESRTCTVPAGGVAFVCHAPEGWVSLFGNTLICPDHKIEAVLVDSKPLDDHFGKFSHLPDGYYWVQWIEGGKWSISEKAGSTFIGSPFWNHGEPPVIGDAIEMIEELK